VGVILTFLVLSATPTDWDVARDALREMFQGFNGLDSVKSVVIYDTRYSSDDAGYLVRSELSHVLEDRGIEVYFAAPLGSEPEIEVRYLVNEMRVVHKKSYRKLLLGRKMIERWVQADIEITVLRDNMVISQKRLTTEEKSTFPESDLDLVRSPFTQEYYSSSSAGSLWEPLIVTAVVGALIYLFYSPKSQ
jgi:hypothetical protein